jgi:hypothetical protein
MTVQEMHMAVNIKLQQVASFSFDDFLPEEIDYYINLAISRWIRAKQQSVILEPDTVPASVSEDLYTLIKSVNFVLNNPTVGQGSMVNSTKYDNAVRLDLKTIPDGDYYLYFYSRSQTNNGWKNNNLVLTSMFNMYTETSTNKPYFRRLPVIFQDNSIYILRSIEDNTINNVLLTYIKKPATVTFDTVDCDLPIHVHDEIVDLTVAEMLKDLIIQQSDGS